MDPSPRSMSYQSLLMSCPATAIMNCDYQRQGFQATNSYLISAFACFDHICCLLLFRKHDLSYNAILSYPYSHFSLCQNSSLLISNHCLYFCQVNFGAPVYLFSSLWYSESTCLTGFSTGSLITCQVSFNLL